MGRTSVVRTCRRCPAKTMDLHADMGSHPNGIKVPRHSEEMEEDSGCVSLLLGSEVLACRADELTACR